MAIILVSIGFLGSLAGGLVGLGGAILVAPLLLLVPPALGLPALDLKTIAGITSLQSLVSSLSGAWGHRSHGHGDWRIARPMGVAGAMAALAGAVGSRWLPAGILDGILGGAALVAALTLLLPHAKEEAGSLPRRRRLVIWGAGIGLISGLLGQGSGFLIVPILVHIFRIPIRTAIGTSLAVAALAAAAGLAGKWLTGQVPGGFAVLVASGALLGAQVGSRLSPRVATRRLSLLLAILIVAAAAQIVWGSLQRTGWWSVALAGLTAAALSPVLWRGWQQARRHPRCAGADGVP